MRVVSLVGNGERKSATRLVTPAFWASCVVKGGRATEGRTSTVRSEPEIAATTRLATASSSKARPSTDGTRRGLPLLRLEHPARVARCTRRDLDLGSRRASRARVSSNFGSRPPAPSGTTETIGAYSAGASSARVVPETSVSGRDIAVLPNCAATCCDRLGADLRVDLAHGRRRLGGVGEGLAQGELRGRDVERAPGHRQVDGDRPSGEGHPTLDRSDGHARRQPLEVGGQSLVVARS